MKFVSYSLIKLYDWLGQASVTPTPTNGAVVPRVDPGNDPTFTAIMYVVFMVALIGGGTLFFRLRMRLIKRTSAPSDSVSESSKSSKS